MALQGSLPGAVPSNSYIASSRLAVWKDDEFFVVYSAADPIHRCRHDDADGLRLMVGLLSSLKLAPDTRLAEAFDVNRETIRRNRKLYEKRGVSGIRSQKGGPKGPTKLKGDVAARAQRCLDDGWSINRTATHVDLTEGTLRASIRRGQLQAPPKVSLAEADSQPRPRQEDTSRPSERAAEDQACELGVATKRVTERVLAGFGKLPEALPKFEAAEAVQGAGVLLALPALLEQGLIEVGQGVYGSLRNGFFGLKSVLLTFCFMALLRIKTLEQLKTWSPGELGLLLGLDRAPVVETLRRKLAEMGQRKLGRLFGERLTNRWAQAEPEKLGLLYFDGHVRVYNGKRDLPKHHVQKRGRPMKGTQDFHVNDGQADPLLCVTAEANESLLQMMDERLLPEVRRLVGPRRRVMVVFDREAWSPKTFQRWRKQGFDVLTYRKGEQTRWQERFFTTRTRQVDGRKVTYRLHERRVRLLEDFYVREVRRLTDDGHQTAVITTASRDRLSTIQVAVRMFDRWRQENYFRYARQEFAIDHLCTTAVEPGDPERLVRNPKHHALEKKIRIVGDALGRLIIRRGDLKLGEKARVGKRTLTEQELEELMVERERELHRLKKEMKGLPKHVPIGEIKEPKEIVQLERERKMLADNLKMVAYRAESSLARLIEPFFKRHQDEARNFLKTVFQETADLIPDEDHRTLLVRFHGLSNPRTTRTLRALCEVVSESETCYPGTNLRLRFEAP